MGVRENVHPDVAGDAAPASVREQHLDDGRSVGPGEVGGLTKRPGLHRGHPGVGGEVDAADEVGKANRGDDGGREDVFGGPVDAKQLIVHGSHQNSIDSEELRELPPLLLVTCGS